MRFVSLIPHAFYDEVDPTPIFAYNTVGGSSVTVYTVPAATYAYITSMTFWYSQRVAAVYYGYINVYDSTPALKGRWLFNGNVQENYPLFMPFNPPLKLDPGDYVQLWTSNSDLVFNLTILGYEV